MDHATGTCTVTKTPTPPQLLHPDSSAASFVYFVGLGEPVPPWVTVHPSAHPSPPAALPLLSRPREIDDGGGASARAGQCGPGVPAGEPPPLPGTPAPVPAAVGALPLSAATSTELCSKRRESLRQRSRATPTPTSRPPAAVRASQRGISFPAFPTETHRTGTCPRSPPRRRRRLRVRGKGGPRFLRVQSN